MLRKYVFILVFFGTVKSFACSCGESNVHEKYNSYETIIKARVIKVYPNSSPEANYFKIDIESIEVFKGKELSSLMVYGSSDGNIRSSCDMYTPVNSTYIMYISKNKNDNEINYLYMCSGSKRIDERYGSKWSVKLKERIKKSRDLEFDVLKFLKANNKEYSDIGIFSGNLRTYIDENKGIEITNRFAFYEITLKSDLSLKEINPLIEFDNKTVSNQILETLKNEKNWVLFRNKKINKDTTFLIGLFYYPAEEEFKSFISIFTV